MLVLAGIVVLHITTIILLLVATIDNVSESIQKDCATKNLNIRKQTSLMSPTDVLGHVD